MGTNNILIKVAARMEEDFIIKQAKQIILHRQLKKLAIDTAGGVAKNIREADIMRRANEALAEKKDIPVEQVEDMVQANKLKQIEGLGLKPSKLPLETRLWKLLGKPTRRTQRIGGGLTAAALGAILGTLLRSSEQDNINAATEAATGKMMGGKSLSA